jgi:hypothetical protein
VKAEEVTEQILGAWDEIVGAETPSNEEANEPEDEQPLEPEDDEALEPGSDDGAAEQEEEEEPSDEEAEETVPSEDEEGEPDEEPEIEGTEFATEDPEIKAFLSKFQGDPEKALRYGLQSQQALSRLNEEKRALAARAQELETQLAQAKAFESGGTILGEEQRAWVGEALESGNPIAYVREAVKAGEFDLARGVCAAWGDHAPYEALRAAQLIDYAEASALEPQEQATAIPQPLDRGELLRVLTDHFPDLPAFAPQMQETIDRLGETHPLVVEARSDDPEQAVRGVVGIYEIARASQRATADAREEIKTGARDKARSAQKRAVVASSGASPSPGETPKPRNLGPGLTLEALDAEWAANT